MAIVGHQRELFDIPRDVAYFNCAYLSPSLSAVAEAGHRAIEQKRHPWELSVDDFFENVEAIRAQFATLLGVEKQADAIALCPSVSYGIATAARNLKVDSGQQILVLAEQFPSNIYSWRELGKSSKATIVTVPRPSDGDWTSAIIDRINDQTAIVAAPQCHWTDGSLVDLAEVGRQCRRFGAALVVDATQSLGAMPLDVQEIQPDFLIAAAYKWLLGPYSLAYLYVAPRYWTGTPLEHNWLNRADSENFSQLVSYRDEFQAGARRFDVGEKSNFTLLPMARVALQQILEWGVPSIAETLGQRTAKMEERAREMGLETLPSNRRGPHMLGIRFPEGVPATLAQSLAESKVYASVRGESMRVAPHLYNDSEDVDRLFKVLATQR